MTNQTDIKATERKPYVTTTSGMRGYFAVLLTWTDSLGGGYYEPFNTGETCKTFADCVKYAKEWAEGLEYIP